jgi:hypothetical protein
VEDLLEVDARMIPGSGKRRCRCARAQFFRYLWIPAKAGMTGGGDLVRTCGLEGETIRTDAV